MSAAANAVPDQLNDLTISVPTPLWNSIEIPDDIQFRTFLADHFLIHRDLANLLGDRRTRWVYNLAREVLATETTIILTSPNGTRYRLSVDDTGTLKTEVVT